MNKVPDKHEATQSQDGPQTLREELAETFDTELLFLDPAKTFDKCIIGVAERINLEPAVIYDRQAIIKSIVDSDGCSYEEAIEHFDFNIGGAYLGDASPIFVDVVNASDRCKPLDADEAKALWAIARPHGSKVDAKALLDFANEVLRSRSA